MSENLNELFAELKAEIANKYGLVGHGAIAEDLENKLYDLDMFVNDGEFARAEQDAVS